MARRIAALAALGVVAAGLTVNVPAGYGAAPAQQRYIVVLENAAGNPGAVAAEHARRYGAETAFVYRHALSGYAASMTARAAAGVARDPRVASVEVDQMVSAFDHAELPTGVDRTSSPDGKHATAGHQTIDGVDDVRVDVDIAIIDTGIDDTHPDLNVVAKADCTGGGPFGGSCTTGSGSDGNGHGTHVAGSAAALDNGVGVVGVAPGARLWAVKVLSDSGSGYMSWIVAGVDWVTARADSIDVANMSLGCECTSSALDNAIKNSVAAGVTYAVAAGNSEKSASRFSPANHPDVITVSALADFDGVSGGLGSQTCRNDQDDTLADFSNWGSLVEVAAPGVCIRSTVPGGYATYSGTSMASPHVAGAAGLLASGSSALAPAQIRTKIIATGNTNWTDDSGDGIQEPLLDVSHTDFTPATVAGSGGGGATNSPPSASYTHTCTFLDCTFTDQSTDSDGTIASWLWEFGDGTTSTAQHPSHTFSVAGSYTVKLTVTDDDLATGSTSKTVDVTSSSCTGWSLAAKGYKVKGFQKADLTWCSSATTATSVDVWRKNGTGSYAKVATTENDGAHTDNINKNGKGSYTYKVCAKDTSTCSDEVTVSFT